MGRKKATERKIGGFSEDDMKKVVDLVINKGVSLRKAATTANVKYVTLYRYVQKKQTTEGDISMVPNYEVRKVFTDAQEQKLKEYILQSAHIFFGLTKENVRKLAYQMAEANNIPMPTSWHTKKVAGLDWLRGFLSRFPALVVRKPEACSMSRLTSFNQKNVNEFFDNLKQVLDKHPDIAADPSRIYNLDETATTTVQAPKRILAQKGVKRVGRATSAERGQLVTTIAMCSAQGNVLPPAMVFPRKNFKEIMLRGAVPGTLGLANPSGWLSTDLFPEVIQHFVKFCGATKERPVLLIMDNAEVHMSLSAIDVAKENGVVILTIPPHCSHRMQPLDVSMFGPFKSFYNAALDSFMTSHKGAPATIYDVAELVCKAYTRGLTPSNIIAGFHSCGMYPFDRHIFSESDFAGASVTDRCDPNEDPQDFAGPSGNRSFLENIPGSSETRPTPAPSVAGESGIGPIMPEQLQPYPKAGPRKKPWVRKRAKSRCLTDTPVRKGIAEKESLRAAKKAKNTKATFLKRVSQSHTPFKGKRKSKDNRDSSSDEDCPGLAENEKINTSDEASWSDASTGSSSVVVKERVFHPLSSAPKPGDYVLIELQKRIFYVARVQLDPADPTVVLVSYLRKSQKVFNAFFYPQVEDLHVMNEEEVKAILPPTIPAKTARLARHICFSFEFNGLNMR